MQRPRRLRPDSLVAIVSPSEPVLDQDTFEAGIQTIRELGWRPLVGESNLRRFSYMAGTDEERASDLNLMLSRGDVDAIVCQSGGSSAIRILPLIDFDRLRKYPKVISGMSDVTNLLVAIWTHAKIPTLHQSTVSFGLSAGLHNSEGRYEIDLFRNIVMQPQALGRVQARSTWECWRPGRASGWLFGGNLSVLVRLAGTPYWPDLTGALLFWEVIGEEIHDIDSMLFSLSLAGAFRGIVGMLVGKLAECEEKEYRGLERPVREIVCEMTESVGFPILAEMDFGHNTPNLPLPVGVRATIDADPLMFSIDEPFVAP
jgi:muramoyltetrapeptide carboxypeptidase